MKENNMTSYEMYEDFKETMVKTIKAELSNKNRHPPELRPHRQRPEIPLY